jgi:L,D-transpeptidase catalytic domain
MTISRRDFLKLGGSALLGCLFSGLDLDRAFATISLPARGRVLYTSLRVRQAPDFSADQVGSLLFDNLVDIVEQVVGGVPEDANHAWYRLASGNYVHSGGIQLVETNLNDTVLEIPSTGVVGEITVPYADTTWAINRSPAPGPRLYFKTTHWVDQVVTDKRDGSLWYGCYDNLWNSHYYTRPAWMRILTAEDLSPLSPDVPADEKHIDVVLDQQLLYAWSGATLVHLARTSTGQDGYETPTGWYRTFHKRPTYHMTGGYDASTTFDLPGVPWDTYISESGIAIHGTFWHNDFGTRHSHGCINLAPDAARWIYRWTDPPVPPGEKVVLAPGNGTRVHVRQSRLEET